MVTVRILSLLALLMSGAAMAADTPKTTAHDFAFTAIDGTPLPLKAFAGKAVLVVNTASQCGFTPQYSALQELWTRYRDKGFMLLGVPSNDFGGQEPGTAAEIKDFCEVNFNVDFPLTEKVAVTGENAHPFYVWAGKELGVLAKPRWNFHKYLIAPDGRLIDWFSTPTKPTAPRVLKAVEAALPDKS
ncbi:MAG: glutathione peroxidase [Rhodospirillaceae bacterium]|nr:glutathione peroxidase [Magnetovibrio sp.]MAY66002.1 glutathione peroxidase [Rhodospirillaceae bacterium]